jgi:hypothetical protein
MNKQGGHGTGIRVTVYDPRKQTSISFTVSGVEHRDVAVQLAGDATHRWPGRTTSLNDRRHKRR